MSEVHLLFQMILSQIPKHDNVFLYSVSNATYLLFRKIVSFLFIIYIQYMISYFADSRSRSQCVVYLYEGLHTNYVA